MPDELGPGRVAPADSVAYPCGRCNAWTNEFDNNEMKEQTG
jgi:cytidine deaminase